ncbi:uncharacterized protein LOC143465904 isoform X1 [Clavelina lepadiformis]|uniref:VWFA domain-containing protein n=1 Tax=Clavelina lepadiformis TaxID=159417 RepID=A0ABP0EW87_CLALP
MATAVLESLIFFWIILTANGNPVDPMGTSADSINTGRAGITFMLGKCPATHYYEKAQNCSHEFFENLRHGSRREVNCTEKYIILRSCMLKTFHECMRDSRLGNWISDNLRQTLVRNYLTFFGNRHLWCDRGGLDVPKYQHAGTNCDSIYPYAARECVATYQLVFNSRSSLKRLCREYNKARTCLQRNLVTHCSFSRRELFQMVEQSIEAEVNFQPFCQIPIKNPLSTLEDLLRDNTCPPRSHADVLFIVDVSKETTDDQLKSMKEAITEVTKKLTYGMSGIRAGLVQYHEKTVMSISTNRFSNKNAFLRALHRVPRIYTTRHRRYTGAALLNLAKRLSRPSGSRMYRPFHTPVWIVLSTGRNEDRSMETMELALTAMRERKIHLVQIGPTLQSNRSEYEVTYHMDDSQNFTEYCGDIMFEICQADRDYREGRHGGVSVQDLPNSLLARFNTYFLRTRVAQLPLLWEPQELVVNDFDVTPSSTGNGSVNELSTWPGFTLEEGEDGSDEEDMDWLSEA